MSDALKQSIYDDYLLIRKLQAPRRAKIKALQAVVNETINNWRVIGITPRALSRFSEHEFRYRSGSGIQRAHLTDRHSLFGDLVDECTAAPAFWDRVSDGDRTILALKDEQRSIGKIEWISTHDHGLFASSEDTYFPSKAVGYRHSRREEEFLRELHERHIVGSRR